MGRNRSSACRGETAPAYGTSRCDTNSHILSDEQFRARHGEEESRHEIPRLLLISFDASSLLFIVPSHPIRIASHLLPSLDNTASAFRTHSIATRSTAPVRRGRITHFLNLSPSRFHNALSPSSSNPWVQYQDRAVAYDPRPWLCDARSPRRSSSTFTTATPGTSSPSSPSSPICRHDLSREENQLHGKDQAGKTVS